MIQVFNSIQSNHLINWFSKIVAPPNLFTEVQIGLGYIVMANISTTITAWVDFCSVMEPYRTNFALILGAEAIPAPHVLNHEDSEYENIFRATTVREETGRFIVELPFKEYPPVSRHSFDEVCQRF